MEFRLKTGAPLGTTEVLVNGEPYQKVRAATLHIAAGALPTADVEVLLDAADITVEHARYYTFFAGERCEVVPLSSYHIVPKDGTNDRLFQDHTPERVAHRLAEYCAGFMLGAGLVITDEERVRLVHGLLDTLNGA